MKPSISLFTAVRGLRYHVRCWGPDDGPPLVLLHGWMDVSASFQFLVDELKGGWRVLAPDWRGFGLTEWHGESYWFPDYLADLDALLDVVSPGQPVALVGHSLGGNVACLYAGARPGRVHHLASLEGFGLQPGDASQAPARYRQWLDQMKQAPQLSGYPSPEAVAARLRKNNPRLDGEKARFLAHHWAQAQPDGGFALRGDPRHKIVNPVLYRLEEAMACWRAIEAPVLWVKADGSPVALVLEQRPREFAERAAAFRNLRIQTVKDAGHMMHHDQPRAVARLVEDFCKEAAR